MATVKGVWVFNETIGVGTTMETVKFSTKGVGCTLIEAESIEDLPGLYSATIYYDGIGTVYDNTDDPAWSDEAYRTIDFGTTEQTVSADFYNWLTANAIRKIQINITENGTVTLATAGKYCDRNIDVNVEVPGGDKHYDTFWNAYQSDGARETYYYGFCGTGWNRESFNPKHQIVVKGSAEGMFRNFNYTNKDIMQAVDLTPFNINWSGCTGMKQTFYNARLLNTGLIDATNCSQLDNTFVNGSTGTNKGCLVKITLKVKAATTYTNPIAKQTELTDLIFTEDSVIGNSGWDLSASPLLSKASVQSIINALSGTATGKSITLPTAVKTNYFTDAEWNTLVGTKSNWTIALA